MQLLILLFIFTLFGGSFSKVLENEVILDDDTNTYGFEFSPFWDRYFNTSQQLINETHGDFPEDFNSTTFGYNDSLGIWLYLAQYPPTPGEIHPYISFGFTFQLIDRLAINCYIHGDAQVNVRLGLNETHGEIIKTLDHSDTPGTQWSLINLDLRPNNRSSNSFVLEILVPEPDSPLKGFFMLDRLNIFW